VLIDWFTVVAQIINFLILVALLRYFLYSRIVKAMDEREHKIASRLEDAEAKKQEAEREVESLHEKQQAIDARREDLLAQAREQAETRRRELIQNARNELEAIQTRWKDEIERERASFVQQFKQMAGREVYAVADRALKDLTTTNLETHLVDVFLDRIKNMDQDAKRQLVQFVQESGKEVVIRTGADLSRETQQKITTQVRESIDEGIAVRYETRSELIAGIELTIPGGKIGWNLKDYLRELEDRAREALDHETKGYREGKTGKNQQPQNTESEGHDDRQ
jgi:F-type H+-transporting ATPase subunit b